MWWARNKTKQNSAEFRCPSCATHPVLVQSGYEDKKSLKCSVCKAFFDSKGLRYDPDEREDKVIDRDPSIEEEVFRACLDFGKNCYSRTAS